MSKIGKDVLDKEALQQKVIREFTKGLKPYSGIVVIKYEWGWISVPVGVGAKNKKEAEKKMIEVIKRYPRRYGLGAAKSIKVSKIVRVM